MNYLSWLLVFASVLWSSPGWALSGLAEKGMERMNPPQTALQLDDVTVTGSATLIKTANPLRYFLNCTNTSASVHVRWGPSTVAANKGQRIPAGTSIEIRNTGPIYMISEGANVTMSCTEELR